MFKDQGNLERFLNSLEGEVVAIIPNVTHTPLTLAARITFLYIIERL